MQKPEWVVPLSDFCEPSALRLGPYWLRHVSSCTTLKLRKQPSIGPFEPVAESTARLLSNKRSVYPRLSDFVQRFPTSNQQWTSIEFTRPLLLVLEVLAV